MDKIQQANTFLMYQATGDTRCPELLRRLAERMQMSIEDCQVRIQMLAMGFQ